MDFISIAFHNELVRPLQLFDVSLRTAYAQAKELASAQATVSLTSPGSLQVEARGAHRFVYRYRSDATGRRTADYLGPEHEPATLAKVEAANLELDEAALLSGYSRDLRRIGFHGTDNSTLVTIAALFNAGVFAGGGVLVGTHAFGAILNELGVRASPTPMTDDVDLARPRRIELAAVPEGGLLGLLRSTGLPFHEVPQLRRNAPATSFKVRGQKLKVDLLVPAKGAAYAEVPVPELGAHATALPHFGYLLDDPAPSVVMGRDRIVPIVIPHAGRYCVHKLAVYGLRADAAKRDKDVQQAAMLAAVLVATQDFLLSEAIEAVNRSLRPKVRAGAAKAVSLLGSDPAAGYLERLAH